MKDKLFRQIFFGRTSKISKVEHCRTMTFTIPSDGIEASRKITIRTDDGLFLYFLKRLDDQRRLIDTLACQIERQEALLNRPLYRPMEAPKPSKKISNKDWDK